MQREREREREIRIILDQLRSVGYRHLVFRIQAQVNREVLFLYMG
jgi:hypothetical protein